MSDHRVDKEISWLSFNERVLQEAADKRNPIVERVRFLGIFSSNQDEFFKVRVADVRRRSLADTKAKKNTEMRALLARIQRQIINLSRKFDEIYIEVQLELNLKKIYFIDRTEVTERQSNWLNQHFHDKILRHIVPIWVTNHMQLDTHLESEVTYLVVEIKDGKHARIAIIVVPDRIPRFINIPPDRGLTRNYFMVADEVIRHSLEQIFKPFVAFDSLNAWSMKFSRDSEYKLDDDLDMSITEKLTQGVKSRKKAEPMRLSYDKNMPDSLVNMLYKQLGIEDMDSIIAGGRYRNFRDFIGFKNPGRKQLEFEKLPVLPCAQFDLTDNVFSAIDQGDIFLNYPYHKFSYFTEFVRQAAADPNVLDIKINIYRVAAQSRVIGSLIDAARNGKKITVNIELQARFDEEHNLELTEKLAESNVRVTLGISGLKVHSKLCVVRRKEDDITKRYTVIATGNFNEKTAKVYTDFALFTAHQEIGQDASEVFNFIDKSYQQPDFKHLWVSPINTRSKIVAAIESEIRISQHGGKGMITAKMNNLVDSKLTDLLYKASAAGVEIKLIVRGMCELKPGVEGLSENISVTSIVDQFLEHTRLLIFHNSGEPTVYISSADWMTRNLDKRVEVTCPIYDQKIKSQLIQIMNLQLADNQKARIVDQEQTNQYVPRGNRRKLRSQLEIYNYLKRQ